MNYLTCNIISSMKIKTREREFKKKMLFCVHDMSHFTN